MRLLKGARCFLSLRSKAISRAPELYSYDRTLQPAALGKFGKNAESKELGVVPEGRSIAEDLTLGAKYFSDKHNLIPINQHLCDSCRQIIQGTGHEAEDVLGNDYHGDFFKHLDAATIRHNAFCVCIICTAVWNRYTAEMKSLQSFEILPLYFDYGVWWKAETRAYEIKFYVFGRNSDQKNNKIKLLFTIVVTMEAMFRPSEVSTAEDVAAAIFHKQTPSNSGKTRRKLDWFSRELRANLNTAREM